MSPNPSRIREALLASVVLLSLTVAACSKSSSPTNPSGGSSGGGSGMSFNFGPFALGQSAQLTFPNAGSFGYHCIPHRSMGMVGTVLVDAGGSDSLVVQIGLSGLSFSPSTAHIKPGGHVRWVNVSGSTVHTVTSD